MSMDTWSESFSRDYNPAAFHWYWEMTRGCRTLRSPKILKAMKTITPAQSSVPSQASPRVLMELGIDAPDEYDCASQSG
jgi:hypothetical protein